MTNIKNEDNMDLNIQKITLNNIYNENLRIFIINNLSRYHSLTELNCHQCFLKEIPELPETLIYFNCNYNSLTKLPKLPDTLINLICSNNSLIKLPELPDTLINLYCNGNKLVKLPILPKKLIDLCCSINNLIYLPALPNSLIKLNCCFNTLTELPHLPKSLIELKCNDNSLTELPDLPYLIDLIKLKIENNPLIYSNFPNILITNYIFKVNFINKIIFNKKNLERMELLNKELLIQHSQTINLTPKRIQRLIKNDEIKYYKFDEIEI